MKQDNTSIFFDKIMSDTLTRKLKWERIPIGQKPNQLPELLFDKVPTVGLLNRSYFATVNNFELYLLCSHMLANYGGSEYRFFMRVNKSSDITEVPLSNRNSGKLSTIVSQMVSQQESKVSSLISNYLNQNP